MLDEMSGPASVGVNSAKENNSGDKNSDIVTSTRANVQEAAVPRNKSPTSVRQVASNARPATSGPRPQSPQWTPATPSRARSPPNRARTPPNRARSPPNRARSPTDRARSPPNRAWSPTSGYSQGISLMRDRRIESPPFGDRRTVSPTNEDAKATSDAHSETSRGNGGGDGSVSRMKKEEEAKASSHSNRAVFRIPRISITMADDELPECIGALAEAEADIQKAEADQIEELIRQSSVEEVEEEEDDDDEEEEEEEVEDDGMERYLLFCYLLLTL